LLSALLERYSKAEWYPTVVYSVFGAMLGAIFYCFYSIIQEKLPEVNEDLKNIDKPIIKRLGEIEKEIKQELQTAFFWQDVCTKGHSVARRILIDNFIKQCVDHILHGVEHISQEEYIRLLHSFSKVATKKIFATSLLSPETWLHGRLRNDYQDYLKLQKELRHEYPDIEITRIFLNKKSEFEKSPHKDKIIELHRDAGIKIGFFDQDDLLETRSDYCKDIVIFEDNEGRWVLDGGGLNGPGIKEERGCVVSFADTSNVYSFYGDLEKYLTGFGVEWC
jgi:hypothetical protein